MTAFICTACGTQYPPSEAPPDACLICTDERQFVPASGQSWTTLEKLRNAHSNKFRRLAAGLTTIETTPAFGIGQRAILARTPAGNVLWDCLALIDDATVDLLQGVGGVAGIAISHPHYYTTMVEWSRALGGVPIHLHAADRQWVTRADPAMQFWEGDTKLIARGLTLVRLGGHFEGGTVLHWADWERRSRRTAFGRHPPGGPEWPRQLYVVLPEPDPALRRQGSAHGGNSGSHSRIRRGLRRVFRPRADRRKRQASGRGVGRALHRADQRDKRSQH